MKKWFSNLLNPERESAPAGHPISPTPDRITDTDAGLDQGSELLHLQKETQILRMELEVREQSIANLKQEIERMRLRQEQILNESVEARLSGLFGDLAGPASQILTQADLLEKHGKPVQARDVLSVARRMIRALERFGIAFAGQVGEQVPFDPNQHTPINEAAQPQAGQTVTVRFVGVTYQGKTIHKAMVE